MKAKNSNATEQAFHTLMAAKDKTLIEQPYIKEFRLRPDFYCPEDETYYEVIGTRQAYYSRRDKIQKAIKAGIKIKVVLADGTPYPGPRKIKQSGTSYTFWNIDRRLWSDVKIAAYSNGISVKDLILKLLKRYVNDFKRKEARENNGRG